MAQQAAARTALVSHRSDPQHITFISALLDPSVTTAVIMEDMQLWSSRWEAYTHREHANINITRNVTVTAVTQDTTLDFAYVSNAVMLLPGIAMTFENLSVRRPRCV